MHNYRWMFVVALLFVFCFQDLFSIQKTSVHELEKKLSVVQGRERVDILNQLSLLYKRNSFQASRKYADEALFLAKKLNYPSGEAYAIYNIGFCYYVLNDLESAEEKYLQALMIFQKLEDKLHTAEILNNLGLVNWKRGQFVSAFQQYREAYKIAREIGYKKLEAESLNYIGLIYWKWSEYAISLDYYLKSLKIKEELGDQFEICVTLNNIAAIYNEMDQTVLSIQSSQKVLKNAHQFDDRYVLGRAYNNLGVSFFKQGNFGKALFYQNESMKIKSEAGDKNGMMYSLNDMGEIELAQKNYRLAENYYKEALKISEEINDKVNRPSILFNIGKLQQVERQYLKAEVSFNRAMEMVKIIHNRKLIAKIYFELANLHSLMGDDTKAYNYMKSYSALLDSVQNQDTRDKMAQLSVMYELNQKENELKMQSMQIINNRIITILSVAVGLIFTALTVILFFRYRIIKKIKNQLEEKNSEIALKSIELEQAIAARNKFFSIVSHDLRSPFFGLKGMTDLMVEQYEFLSDEERKDFLKKLNRSVKDLYLHLENLLDWSRIQFRGIEVSQDYVIVNDEVQYAASLLSANADKKRLIIAIEVPENVIVYADQKMVRSVLQNLLSNAIKFTDEGGAIRIYAEDTGPMFKISVADTGRGIPEAMGESLFDIDTMTTLRGTNNELGTGLGLIICKELIKGNGGEISFVTEIGKGTTFSFTLPKSPIN